MDTDRNDETKEVYMKLYSCPDLGKRIEFKPRINK